MEVFNPHEEKEELDFLVEKDNWKTLLVFLACQTQWKRDFVGMDGTLVWKGLDYPGIAVVIRMQGYRGQEAREIFDGLQVMEAAALPLLNKPKK